MKPNHLPLVIGVSLPFIIIILISIIIFLPSLYIKPKHNFLFTNQNTYFSYNQEYQNIYKIENESIELEKIPAKEGVTQTKFSPNIYLYDIKSNTTQEISFEEAKKYSLNPGPSSPDGYTVSYVYDNNSIFELFVSNNNNSGYFIMKNNGKKKLTGIPNKDNYYGYGNFNLIGWIK